MVQNCLISTPGIYIRKPANFSCDLQAAACYISFQERFLFLQKAQGHWCENKWGIPCGRIEANEKLSDAAVREIKEETGIRIAADLLQYQGHVFVVSLERTPYIFHTFSYTLDQEMAVTISEEHQNFTWATYEEAKMLDLIPFQKEALSYYQEGKF